MRIPVTISFYIGRQFLGSVALVLGVMSAIIMLFDALELIRRSYGKNIPFDVVIEMVLLKFPSIAQHMIPFAVMLGSILAFSRLTRTNELIIIRAAGVSAWRFLMPAVLVSLLLGIFVSTIFNPLSSIMLTRFERVEAKYMHGAASMLSVSSSGLWLREKRDKENSIIHSLRVTQEKMRLFDVTIFMFSEDNSFIRRIDAKTAQLQKNKWELAKVIITSPHKPAVYHETYQIPTQLTLNQLQDSFSSPESISFWMLPGFIKTLKNAGFSALRHTLHWYSLLMSPFFLGSMVFIGAAFSLQLPRRGKTGWLMAAGMMVGFLIYFLSDLVSALGLAGNIPVELAASVPVAISLLIGTALMLHLEDG